MNVERRQPEPVTPPAEYVITLTEEEREMLCEIVNQAGDAAEILNQEVREFAINLFWAL